MSFSPLPYTDLAREAADMGGEKLPDGVTLEKDTSSALCRTTVFITTDEAAKRLSRPKGIYHTLEGGLFPDGETAAALSSLLAEMLPSGDVLILGLGSRTIETDSLGPLVCERILTSPTADGTARRVCALSPDTTAKTGLGAFAVVSALLLKERFSSVIAVDSLAARDPSHIGKTVQLSNAGIAPGSGAGAHSAALTKESLGVPVLALGVPTVVVHRDSRLITTTRDLTALLSRAADTLAAAINCALLA